MLNELREGLKFYLTHLSWIDFVAYIWLVLMFVALIFLCVYIMGKSQIFGFLLLVLNFCAFVFGLFYLNHFLDQNLRARSLEIVSKKQLTYSDTLLVDLDLVNLSKKPFGYCRVDIGFYKPSNSSLKERINMLKPLLKKRVVLKEAVDTNETRRIEAVINNFKLRDYNITATSECF